MPGVLAACAEAGATLHDIDAVVVGTGPGPFTGLRVGMVTAAALGDALDIPVHGVCSLDAIAAEAVRDAARRPAARHRRAPARGVLGGLRRGRAADRRAARAGARRARRPAGRAGRRPRPPVPAPAVLGLPVVAAARRPGPAGLVACALDALRAGARPGPLEPLYLRRPDAVGPARASRCAHR